MTRKMHPQKVPKCLEIRGQALLVSLSILIAVKEKPLSLLIIQILLAIQPLLYS